MNGLPPLAERMRPKNLEDYIGQEHLLSENAPLTRALDAGIIPSMIFWGPPGVGKTTLAYLIAEKLKKFAKDNELLSVGSYPFQKNSKYGTNIVIRGKNNKSLDEAFHKLSVLFSEMIDES